MEDYNLNVTPQESAFRDDPSLYGKPIKTVPTPARNIGVDTHDTFFSNIIEAGESNQMDMTKLQSFLQIAQTRDQLYQLLDTMSEDPIISAILETYAEDATETNDSGQIVWCESEDPEIVKYVMYLLDTMNVDKNAYKWVYTLCKYGDLYIRLFRTSDIQDALFDKQDKDRKKLNEQFRSVSGSTQELNEDINVIVYPDNDKYVHYVESMANPAQMFELTQFGKSYAYIQAKTPFNTSTQETAYFNTYQKYQFQQSDIDVYDATTFVHAALEDSGNRSPEEVEIFTGKSEEGNPQLSLKYSVRRGQSLLYNTFKVWRELMLLENSLLLNRITKSSIVRIVGVEVGDMPKEEIGPKLRSIKQLIEQKSALNAGTSLQEYTNPGPMENNVYVPTKNGVGAITTQQVGGDVDVKGLADIDYFKSKLYGSMRIPKQYFGDTDDSTGFNGGTSLSIISSRYAKAVKRIQNTFLQALTDAVNLMLLDKGLNSYVNHFQLKMVAPTTQEEIDRRDALQAKVSTLGDIMDLLSDVEDKATRLRILQCLLSSVVTDSDVLALLQEYAEKSENEPEMMSDDQGVGDNDLDIDLNMSPNHRMQSSTADTPLDMGFDDNSNIQGSEGAESSSGKEQILPTPGELNAGDFTDNTLDF